MGGWFLDVYIVYLFRTLVRVIEKRRGRMWPTTYATVMALERDHGVFSGTTANVIYTYEVGDDVFTGTNSKPFISSFAAESYLSNYSIGGKIVVRFNPDQQEISLMLDVDQETLINKITNTGK